MEKLFMKINKKKIQAYKPKKLPVFLKNFL